jgi:hypothetical protein
VAPLTRIAERLTYANVVATLALFVALGGASYAAIQLPANSVGRAQLRNGAVGLKALGFPLGTASVVDQRVQDIPNGACNGPLFPGQKAVPPCYFPRVRRTPGREVHLAVRSAGRLLISGTVGLTDRGGREASAEVTAQVIVDGNVKSEAQTNMMGDQVVQLPIQALVPVTAGSHAVGLSVRASYDTRPEDVLVAPVSVIATALPAARR